MTRAILILFYIIHRDLHALPITGKFIFEIMRLIENGRFHKKGQKWTVLEEEYNIYEDRPVLGPPSFSWNSQLVTELVSNRGFLSGGCHGGTLRRRRYLLIDHFEFDRLFETLWIFRLNFHFNIKSKTFFRSRVSVTKELWEKIYAWRGNGYFMQSREMPFVECQTCYQVVQGPFLLRDLGTRPVFFVLISYDSCIWTVSENSMTTIYIRICLKPNW